MLSHGLYVKFFKSLTGAIQRCTSEIRKHRFSFLKHKCSSFCQNFMADVFESVDKYFKNPYKYSMNMF